MYQIIPISPSIFSYYICVRIASLGQFPFGCQWPLNFSFFWRRVRIHFARRALARGELTISTHTTRTHRTPHTPTTTHTKHRLSSALLGKTKTFFLGGVVCFSFFVLCVVCAVCCVLVPSRAVPFSLCCCFVVLLCGGVVVLLCGEGRGPGVCGGGFVVAFCLSSFPYTSFSLKLICRGKRARVLLVLFFLFFSLFSFSLPSAFSPPPFFFSVSDSWVFANHICELIATDRLLKLTPTTTF